MRPHNMPLLVSLFTLFLCASCSGGGEDSSGSVVTANNHSSSQAKFALSSALATDGKTTWTFDASSSTQAGQYRWDFNGDGNYDTDWSSDAQASYRYLTAGSFNAKLSVRNTEHTDESSISQKVEVASIPNVVGKTQSEAQSLLNQSKLNLGNLSHEASSTVALGLVIRSSPAASLLVGSNQSVDLVLSSSQPSSTAQAVLSLSSSWDGAKTQWLFDAAGSNGANEFRFDFDGDGNYDTSWASTTQVIHTYTQAGRFQARLQIRDQQQQEQSTSQTVVVLESPNLVGQNQSNAETVLAKAALVKGQISQAYSASIPVGQVSQQQPIAGQLVAVGQVFKLEISLGQAPTPVDDQRIPADPATLAPVLDPSLATDFVQSTSFIYSGVDPIQRDVKPETIEARRMAILRGKVLDRDSQPVAGVKITAKDHDELGYTLTRMDGQFDFAVNGGGQITLNYDKAGLLPIQRRVQAPWQDFAYADDVVMLALDPEVTKVDLSLAGIKVHRASPINDGDGARQNTLLIPEGVSARMKLPDGSTQALTQLNIRATEYTVGAVGPKAMPGPLPSTSAYTYAVELSVDEAIAAGATTVEFSKPVINYVDNFLHFPIGTVVPSGYYDRTKSAWLASDNGRVIKILSVNSGVATLDTDGDNLADTNDQLAALAIDAAELKQLAGLYGANAELWRVPVNHFTPWDYNWPYGPPDDFEQPKNIEDHGNDHQPDPCAKSGSIIECENQVLGEKVPLAGTAYALHYRSDRQAGYGVSRLVKVNLSGEKLPASLIQIHLQIEIAGQRFSKVFEPEPNQSYEWLWDGNNAFGQKVNGPQTATIRVGYEYPLVYKASRELFERAFAKPATGGGAASGGNTWALAGSKRTMATLLAWSMTTKTLEQSLDNSALGFGGWALDAQEVYFPKTAHIMAANAPLQRSAGSVDKVVKSLSGEGLNFASGQDGSLFVANRESIGRYYDDGRVVDVHIGVNNFYSKRSVIKLSDSGFVFVMDSNGLHKIDNNNNVEDVCLKDNSDPKNNLWQFGKFSATDFAVSSSGEIFFEKTGYRFDGKSGDYPINVDGYHVYRLNSDCGQDLLADIPGGNDFVGIEADNNGGLFILSGYSYGRVDRVSKDGDVSVFAGKYGDISGFSGDGGLAIDATLQLPLAMLFGRDSNLYVAHWNSDNIQIRKINSDGIITTIAGGNVNSNTSAADDSYIRLAQTPDMRLLTLTHSGSYNSVVRQMSALPSIDNNEIAIPQGSVVRIFSLAGRHLRTLNGLNGAVLQRFSYNDLGQLASITDSDGNTTTFDRSNPAQIVVTAPDHQVTRLNIGTDGRLQSIVNPANETISLTYHASGLLQSFTNARRVTSSFIYDDYGRLLQDQSAGGEGWSLARTALKNGFQVKVQSALGRADYLTQVIDGLGNVIRTNTKPDGSKTSTTQQPNGSVSQVLADGTKIESQQAPDPRFGMAAAYEQQSQTTTPSGLTVTDTRTRSVTLAEPADPFSLTELTETLTHAGRTSTSHYNAASRTWTLTSAEQRVSSQQMDAKDRLSVATVAGIAPVTYSYDNRGRLQQISQGSGAEVRRVWLDYDPVSGYLSQITDPLNRVTRFELRDPVGRVKRSVLPDGRKLAFSYDANGNLVSLTPPEQPIHEFDYNSVDLLKTYIPPIAETTGVGLTDYRYDKDKALTEVIHPDGLQLDYRYNGITGQLERIISPRGELAAGYYASSGQLKSLLSPDGIGLSFAYDGFLPTSETWSGPIQGSVQRSYYADLQLQDLLVNDIAIRYQYDNDGLIRQAGDLSLTLDQDNGLLRGTHLGTVVTQQDYNAFGELSQLRVQQGAHNLYELSIPERDALGRIITRVETLAGLSSTWRYGYDDANRLTTVSKNGSLYARYSYDANGNRETYTGPLGNVADASTLYDDQDRVSQYGAWAYSYNARGDVRQIRQGTSITELTYDLFGNLNRVLLPDATEIDYLHDGSNRRVGKKRNGRLVQGWLYQDSLRPVAELDASGNVVSRFVYASRSNVPDYMVKNGDNYRLISDQIGSVRLVVNAANGSIVQQLDYDEFGNVLQDTNPGFQPFGFAGGLYDADSQLVRFGARDYEPRTGRWTAKDPIRFAGGDTNIYAYVGSDPVNFTDPTGQNALGGAVEGGTFGAEAGSVLGPWGAVAGGVVGAVVGGIGGYLAADALGNLIFSKGERGYAGNAGGTSNPGKHWKDDPANPGWGWEKNPQTGKKSYKRRPPYIPDPEKDKGSCSK